MKKIITLTVLLFIAVSSIWAQTTDTTQKITDTVRKKKVIVKTYTTVPATAIYVEAGGNSIYWSANYDRRFSKRLDGLGWRIGAGYFPINNSNVLVVPMGINFLAGKKGHFVELGLNVTVANSNPKNTVTTTESRFGQIDFTTKKTQLIYGTSMGYRYQQANKKGFHFRAGIEPILGNRIDDQLVFAITGHISFGYSF